MQLDDWSAYRETVRYARELALLLPSSWSGLLNGDSPAAVYSSSADPSSLTPLVLVKQVEAPLLTHWMVAATSAPVAYHCGSSSNGTEEVDCAAAVVVARWTRLLGIWIALRLEHLRSRCGVELAREEAKEVERYRQYFVPLAWPILDRRMREWLTSCLFALAEKWDAWRPVGDTSCASDAAASAVCGTMASGYEKGKQECEEVCTRAMEATQRVGREYLRISWQVLHPRSIPGTVDSKLKRLYPQVSQYKDYETDSSTPLPAVVHTHCLGDLLQALTRLQLLPDRQRRDCDSAPWLTFTQNALLHIGYDLLTKVRASLIERCYYVIPAVVDYESCLLLCEAMLRKSALSKAREEELSRTQSILRLTLQSLLQSALDFYHHSIRALLVGYKEKGTRISSAGPTLRLVKVPAPANPLSALQQAAQAQRASEVTFPLEPSTDRGAADGFAAAAIMRLSEPAFAVLVEVLEPTCDLLQRYPAGENALWTRPSTGADERDESLTPHSHTTNKGRLFPYSIRQERLVSRQPQCSTSLGVRRELMSFLEAKMCSCFADAAAGSGTAARKAQRQAATDAYLTARYLSTYGPHGP
ncbi:hypothetical protein LSCM1_01102 [Leishmania martiniquensis]|uniref:Uncharacterized protein n=1 Tax=Leishmania martiniquensis TaxID=1580590 RepID=A0A836KDL1_9TRYP|nr:hypothetical protein LSCM1_01102 [Leishmania martiniquensis]